VLNLARDDAYEFQEAVIAMGDAEGAVARAREEQQKSFQYQLKLLLGSLENLLIVIGDKILPILKRFVEWLTPLIQKLTELPDPILIAGIAIAAVAAAIGPLA